MIVLLIIFAYRQCMNCVYFSLAMTINSFAQLRENYHPDP